jgi:hypothetical protein
LSKKAWLKISQICTLSVERIGKVIGKASPEELNQAIEGRIKMPGVLAALDADQIVSALFRRIAKRRDPEGPPMRLRRIMPLLFCVLISLNGCILLPIPTQEYKVLAGTPVTEEQLVFLAPNITTKSEVTARLGSPDVIWEDARLFAYNWVVRQGILIWAVGAGYSGRTGILDIPKRYMLLIQFDEQDRVQRFERAVRPSYKSYGDFLKEWIGDSDKKSSEGLNKRQD